jgi:hypothetical protein
MLLNTDRQFECANCWDRDLKIKALTDLKILGEHRMFWAVSGVIGRGLRGSLTVYKVSRIEAILHLRLRFVGMLCAGLVKRCPV